MMFKNRFQVSAGGMRVEEVNNTKIKVNGQWWSPDASVRHDDWLRAQRATLLQGKELHDH